MIFPVLSYKGTQLSEETIQNIRAVSNAVRIIILWKNVEQIYYIILTKGSTIKILGSPEMIMHRQIYSISLNLNLISFTLLIGVW